MLDRPSATPACNETLVELCLQHVEWEERSLAESLRSARQLHEALLQGGDRDALWAAFCMLYESSLLAEKVKLARERLVCEAAASLGVAAETITLRELAGRCGGDAALRLESSRQRLVQLAHEVKEQNEKNCRLLRHGLNFMELCFGELLGNPSVGRYGPRGQIPKPSSGCLVQARG